MISTAIDARRGSAIQPLIIALIAVSAAKCWLAAAMPLTEDEAYYRIWAAHLQFGYYDHPPMIAWWIWLGESLLGSSALGVRIIPVISTALTSLIVYQVLLDLGASRFVARRGAIWYQATILFVVAGFVATPDAPATFFWALTLLFVIRAGRTQSLNWWMLAGVAAGMAILSKYSALFLLPGIFLWMVFDPRRRQLLQTPGPWIAALLAGVIFALNIHWNMTHEWVTFIKQFGRATPDTFDPINTLEFVFSQFVLVSPVIFALAVCGLTKGLGGRFERRTMDTSLLVFTTLPFVAYLLFHSLHSSVQAHWTAPLYPGLTVLAVLFASEIRPSVVSTAATRSIVPLAVIIFAILTGIGILPQFGAPFDPAHSLRGWQRFASDIDEHARTDDAKWIGTMSYGTKAQLANQPSLTIPVVQLFERERYPQTDNSWGADVNQPGLVIDLNRRIYRSDLELCFETVNQHASIYRGTTAYAVYEVRVPLNDQVLSNGCWNGRPPSRR